MRPRRASIDSILLGTVVVLLLVSAEMVYSASFVVAHNEFNDDTHFLLRQLMWIALGLLAMSVLAQLDYRELRRFSLPLLLLGIVGLVLVLAPSFGTSNYGAARWLKLGSLLQFQPSEYIKLAMVLYMADWLSRKGHRISEFSYSSLPFVIILGIIAGLVVVEPDFGTAVVIVLTAVSVFFVAGANLLHFVFGLMLSAAGMWAILTAAAYRMDRLQAWIDPWKDLQGLGWHTAQTLICIGSGGPTGLGLGASRQKFYWVPNAHTDAIFCVIGEELGLIGTVGVLALFVIIGWRGLRIALRAPDIYGRLIAAGITMMIVWQAWINIAVVTNTLPYTGITLPFVSFGGNSLVISLAGVGLLLSVSRRANAAAERRRPEREEGEEPGPATPRTAREHAARQRAAPAEPLVLRVGELEEPISLRMERAPRFGRRGRG